QAGDPRIAAHGQLHEERGALSLARALGVDSAVVELDEGFRDREPEAEPAVARARAAGGLFEGLEDPLERGTGETDAGIDHGNAEPAGFRVFGRDPDRAAVARELDRVLQEVPEDLLEAARIGLGVVVRGGEVELE